MEAMNSSAFADAQQLIICKFGNNRVKFWLYSREYLLIASACMGSAIAERLRAAALSDLRYSGRSIVPRSRSQANRSANSRILLAKISRKLGCQTEMNARDLVCNRNRNVT